MRYLVLNECLIMHVKKYFFNYTLKAHIIHGQNATTNYPFEIAAQCRRITWHVP